MTEKEQKFYMKHCKYNKETKEVILNLVAELEKKEKMIDELISAMAKNHCSITDVVQDYICDHRCVGNDDWDCYKCIKQYFEKKVEE